MDKTEKRWHFRDQQAPFRKKLPACCLRVRKSREIPECQSQTASKWIKLKNDGIFVIGSIGFLFRGFRKKLPACCLRVRKSREIPECQSQTASKWIKLKSEAYPPRKHRFFIPGLQKKASRLLPTRA